MPSFGGLDSRASAVAPVPLRGLSRGQGLLPDDGVHLLAPLSERRKARGVAPGTVSWLRPRPAPEHGREPGQAGHPQQEVRQRQAGALLGRGEQEGRLSRCRSASPADDGGQGAHRCQALSCEEAGELAQAVARPQHVCVDEDQPGEADAGGVRAEQQANGDHGRRRGDDDRAAPGGASAAAAGWTRIPA